MHVIVLEKFPAYTRRTILSNTLLILTSWLSYVPRFHNFYWCWLSNCCRLFFRLKKICQNFTLAYKITIIIIYDGFLFSHPFYQDTRNTQKLVFLSSREWTFCKNPRINRSNCWHGQVTRIPQYHPLHCLPWYRHTLGYNLGCSINY